MADEANKYTESAADAMLRAAQQAISGLGDLQDDAASAGAGDLDELTKMALAAGAEEAGAADAKKQSAAANAKPLPLPELQGVLSQGQLHALEMLSDVNLHVKIELGRTRMLVEDVLRLNEGAVVELDKLAGDPVDVYVNDRHVARGEVHKQPQAARKRAERRALRESTCSVNLAAELCDVLLRVGGGCADRGKRRCSGRSSTSKRASRDRCCSEGCGRNAGNTLSATSPAFHPASQWQCH
jgi:flagellar motor switch protein FliN/FliY